MRAFRSFGTTVIAVFAGSVPALAGSQAELAYLAVSDGYWEVWVSNADGSQARQVTTSKYDKTRVSWFPDGSRLLASGNDGNVLIIDQGGKEARVPLEQFPVVDAALSPDGQQIAYSFSSAIDGNDIWVADVDGQNTQRVVRMAGLQHEPVWAPDGSSVYFLSGDGGQAHDIWKVSLARRDVEQITVGNLYHFDVAVSRDGALAYSSNRSGNYEIYVQRPGMEAVRVTDDPALDARPTFSPDGRQLVFESSRGGTLNLWLVDLDTGRLRQITHTKQGARAPAWYQGIRE